MYPCFILRLAGSYWQVLLARLGPAHLQESPADGVEGVAVLDSGALSGTARLHTRLQRVIHGGKLLEEAKGKRLFSPRESSVTTTAPPPPQKCPLPPYKKNAPSRYYETEEERTWLFTSSWMTSKVGPLRLWAWMGCIPSQGESPSSPPPLLISISNCVCGTVMCTVSESSSSCRGRGEGKLT